MAGEGTLATPLAALPAYKNARKPVEELGAAGGSRFPFADRFELRRDRVVDAATVIGTLEPMITEDRVQRVERVRQHVVAGLWEGGTAGRGRTRWVLGGHVGAARGGAGVRASALPSPPAPFCVH